MNNGKINVTVWNEYWHEQSEERIRKVYPEGIHAAVAAALNEAGNFNVTTAETESQWDAWYEEAKAISGIDQSYDDAGNAITG